jgi:Na+/melibiose symporter-like transporter
MSAVPLAPERMGSGRQFLLSCYWLAYNLQWGALLAVVLPSQIAELVGDDRKELFNGIILGLGALLSLFITPLAGALSDRSRSRFGRRRPYLVAGTLINVAALVWLSRFGAEDPILLFLFAYLAVQLGSNWAGGPYAALIPDLVPRRERGAASGWLALMTAIGTLIGALAAGALARPGHYREIDLLIAAVLLLMLALTTIGVREVPAVRSEPDPARSPFFPDARRHRDFYWVLLTRALVSMGIYSVFTFFLYFLKDVVGAAKPEEATSLLIGVIIAAGIPTSLVAGQLSDRWGRKPLVYASGGLMALASVVFIAAGIWPSLPFTFVVGALFGIGYGAYQAVDWALAVDVLPEGGGAAKDMGIWHVALVLPQVVAPAVTGAILAALKPLSLLAGYTTVFIITAVWFVLGTWWVKKVRSAR